MNYMDIASSNYMLIVCTLAMLVITMIPVLFFFKARKRALELNISKQTVNKVVLNSAMFSILPSLPIIVLYLTLSVSLGKFFPWLRLSVVGSAVYEGMAMNFAMKNMGLEPDQINMIDTRIYGLIMWVMSIGIIWGILFNIFFMKSLDKFSKKLKTNYANVIPIMSAALFCGMLVTISTPSVLNFSKLTNILTFFMAGFSAIFFNKLAKITNKGFLSDFSLPLSLITGMITAIIYSKLFV